MFHPQNCSPWASHAFSVLTLVDLLWTLVDPGCGSPWAAPSWESPPLLYSARAGTEGCQKRTRPESRVGAQRTCISLNIWKVTKKVEKDTK